MNATQRNWLSIFLMTSSLLLLLLFLCFWLKNVYSQKYEALQKDTDYLFSASIRAIEREMLEDIYGAPLFFKSQDSIKNSTLEIRIDHHEDTLLREEFMREETEISQADSIIKFTFRTEKEEGKNEGMFGSLGLVFAIQKDSIGINPTLNIQEDSSIFIVLDQYLKKEAQAAKIPLTYKVIRLEDQVQIAENFVSTSYTDLINGQRYAIEYEDYKPYLLKSMLPEFSFSVFLFSCIAFAFFVVYRSLQKQRKLAQLKNDFISNITHELKTPITTVGVAIEALSDFEGLKNPERTEEYLDISKQELKRLSILVDKVLKMSLFEKKEPELKLELLNLNTLIRDILETMKLQFEKLNAKVNFQPLENDVNLSGDRVHLTSVLYNLIDNALKYSSTQPVIDLNLEHSEDQIRLNISDKGIGIAAEYKDKIFEKFFRVPTGDQHNTKGHGLGLSYVASVIKKHKGTIEVKSHPNSGTCFSIYLPKHHDED